jgi:N-acylneuraminate cytidylyltransferase
LLGGKPLIQYSIETARALPFVTDVVVSTDDEEIANIAKKLGAEVPELRPRHLATDEAATLDVIVYTVDLLKLVGRHYDYIVLLQPTSPFRLLDEIEMAFNKLVSNNADSIISVSEIPHKYNPHWAFESDNQGFLQIATGEKIIISRRQDLPKSYFRNGSLYILKASNLSNRTLYGENILGFVTIESVNIDSEEDFESAKFFLRID